jgi:hypothetical protein
MPDKQIQKEPLDIELPQAIIDSLARFLVPEIRKYYESEQGQKEFEEWLEENQSNNEKGPPN